MSDYIQRVKSYDGRIWATRYEPGWTIYSVSEGLVAEGLSFRRAMARIGRLDLVVPTDV